MRILLAVAFTILPLNAMAQMSTDDLIGQLKTHPDPTSRGIHAQALTSPTAPRGSFARVVARVPARTAPVAQPEQGQANLTVQFVSGSDKLTPAAMHTLDILGQALSSPDLAGNKFKIVGHTDSVGNPDANQILSERRAAAVVSYLADRYRVDPARLTSVGMGQAQPLVPTQVGVPSAENRRVQVINLGA